MIQNPSDPRVTGAWIVGLTSLIVYAITIAPTVAFWDAGEFLAASYSLGITHPPGAPTFVLLGRLFAMLPTPFGVAVEVNFISVIASAITALLLYGIILELLRLWRVDGAGEDLIGDESGLSPRMEAIAAGTGALAYAFSHSAWFNAVEAEVYSLSMMASALCIWLVLQHIKGKRTRKSISLLLLIGYLFGIGAANHLLILITIPSILILLWCFDRKTLFRIDLWVGAGVLFALGYTIYTIIYIRSGLNPPIDITNPENWQNFMQVLQRKQYGSESMLLGIFDRRADFWSYQLNFQFLRYLKTEFFLPFYFIAVVGAVFDFYRNRKTFLANLALWTIMGLGLVVYLNMPDPQPRDREYIYVGCYFATAIWIGLGTAGIATFIREYLREGKSVPRTLTAVVGITCVLLVTVQLILNFNTHDRSRDHIAWDYGYNILQSCEENAILFTNGDNDTYPLWYLQTVEGIRPDVKVVNLSILNLKWYIKQIKNEDPGVPMVLTDGDIDMINHMAFPADTTLAFAGIEWKVPGNKVIRIQDQIVAYVIAANNWERPIYFAITVPDENQAFFETYRRMVGFAWRIRPWTRGVDTDVAEHNLREVFQFRGITDPRIYKDENTTILIHNYRVVFTQTADGLLSRGDVKGAYDLLEWGDEIVDLSPPDSRTFHAIVVQSYGDSTRAQQMLESVLDKQFVLPRNMIRSYLGLMYSYAATNKFEDAARIVNKWLLISPNDTEARNWLNMFNQGQMPPELQQIAATILP